MTFGPGRALFSVVVGRFTFQSPVRRSLLPCRMIWLFSNMDTCSLSKIAIHPASHSCPMDRSDVCMS